MRNPIIWKAFDCGKGGKEGLEVFELEKEEEDDDELGLLNRIILIKVRVKKLNFPYAYIEYELIRAGYIHKHVLTIISSIS
jgi:hypothetical protein